MKKPVIAEAIREEVEHRLRQIEAEEGVRVFYACESGSRAWGFPSKDSDYDVRFLYAHPRNWYLSIDVERKRDVIERPINDALDIGGWDLRKALQLFRKSNVDRLVTSPPLRKAIEDLLAVKRAGEEVGRGPRIPPISDFIQKELERLETKHVDVEDVKSDIEGLNVFFREARDELWPE